MDDNDRTIPVNLEQLVILLQNALGNQDVRIHDWELQPLKGGLEFDSSIYRLQGLAMAGGEARNWSLILKVIRPEKQFDDSRGYRYWKREALAYQSGLLQELPCGVTAPRCYDINENTDGSVWK